MGTKAEGDGVDDGEVGEQQVVLKDDPDGPVLGGNVPIGGGVFENLAIEHGLHVDAAPTGRNVLTRGVRLNDLVGKRFRVGELECRGIELCEPCMTLEARTQPGVIKALVHRAGLNAEILVGGELRPGDAATPP